MLQKKIMYIYIYIYIYTHIHWPLSAFYLFICLFFQIFIFYLNQRKVTFWRCCFCRYFFHSLMYANVLKMDTRKSERSCFSRDKHILKEFLGNFGHLNQKNKQRVGECKWFVYFNLINKYKLFWMIWRRHLSLLRNLTCRLHSDFVVFFSSWIKKKIILNKIFFLTHRDQS